MCSRYFVWYPSILFKQVEKTVSEEFSISLAHWALLHIPPDTTPWLHICIFYLKDMDSSIRLLLQADSLTETSKTRNLGKPTHRYKFDIYWLILENKSQPWLAALHTACKHRKGINFYQLTATMAQSQKHFVIEWLIFKSLLKFSTGVTPVCKWESVMQ